MSDDDDDYENFEAGGASIMESSMTMNITTND